MSPEVGKRKWENGKWNRKSDMEIGKQKSKTGNQKSENDENKLREMGQAWSDTYGNHSLVHISFQMLQGYAN